MKRQKSDSRQLFLDTGVQILLDQGIPEGINIKVIDVCRALGLTTGAAYNIWRKQEDYQRDLALHILSANFDWSRDVADRAVHEGLEAGAGPDELIWGVSRAYFNLLAASREFYLSMHLWSVANPRPELEEAIRQSYEQLHNGLVSLFGVSQATFGRQMRSPHTIDDMAVAATALSEGMALRHRFDPKATRNGELYADTVLALFHQMTEPVDPDVAGDET